MKPSRKPYDIVKRLADIVFSAALLVVLSPLLLMLALLVRMRLGSPVLFTQLRPGRDGQLFRLRKFRSMLPVPSDTPATAAVASDADRLTRFGRLLRSTSLDELPELYNVLVGEMSIVGPRPLLPEYLERYNETQARRHEVRPGITGWAQVNGRNAATWDERLAADVHYVEHRSLALDLRILVMTVGAVLGGSGVSAPDSATMEPFDPRGETRTDATKALPDDANSYKEDS